jgi:gamma-glutamyltranspeptidase/glutathione hydrolase
VFRDFQSPGRSAVYGTRAMIATSHYEASLIGVEILRRGGSAIDAAIAACAMHAVVEPAMTGIGGDCFAIVARPGEAPVTLNGSGRAPAGATLERAREAGCKTAIADNSPFAVTVPGTVDAWCRLHQDYGKLDLASLLEPAARRAEEGYPIAERVGFDFHRHRERLCRHAETAALFAPGGKVPGIGDIHSQPALAQTLRAIGRDGRKAFYEGAVAEEIVATLRGFGGVHTLDDFSAQGSDYAPPVSGPFQGYDVLECPPNGQGAAALLILQALEGWPRFEQADERERVRILAGAMRAAYDLRDSAIGDPATMRVGMEEFLSERAVAFVREAVDTPMNGAQRTGTPPWETDTICLSAVDEDGLVVSFINSLFHPFGSTILAPKSGVLLHCRGASFHLVPGHPNELAPRKRPMHTIIPAMLAQNGRPVMPFGVMGGQYQAAGHAHFLLRLLRDGFDLQSAIDAPRLFGYGPSLQVETGIDDATVAHLRAAGNKVEVQDSPLGGAQAIWIDHARGVLIGGSDPRKDGCALGY